MIAVIFEALPHPGQKDAYLEGIGVRSEAGPDAQGDVKAHHAGRG